MLDLSIIIVSYNTRKLLVDCLESVKLLKGKVDFEVIVVDNNSKDDSVKAVKRFEKDINLRIIKNKENKGFGAANNQGMEIAKGDHILLLNSDTVINPEAVLKPLSFIKEDEEIGVISTKLRSLDDSIQSNGGYFPNYLNVLFWMSFLDDVPIFYKLISPYHIEPEFEADDIRYQDWITGAFFLLKREIFEEVGGFDEDYFMYVEEMDYCYRIKQKDWKIVYYPESEIVHFGGASGTSESALINEFKGLKLFYRKHKNGDKVLSMLLKFGSVMRILMFSLLGDKGKAAVYKKAYHVV